MSDPEHPEHPVRANVRPNTWLVPFINLGHLLDHLVMLVFPTVILALARVWDRPHGDAQQNLRVHVASVRRKLERDPVRPTLIITEPGVGYRFEPGR